MKRSLEKEVAECWKPWSTSPPTLPPLELPCGLTWGHWQWTREEAERVHRQLHEFLRTKPPGENKSDSLDRFWSTVEIGDPRRRYGRHEQGKDEGQKGT